VTVVGTTAESYVATAARVRKEVAEMADTRKCQKHSELSTAYLFLPIAVETLGPVNDSAYEFFKLLSRKITDVSGDSEGVSFFQGLLVIIQRFNTTLFHDVHFAQRSGPLAIPTAFTSFVFIVFNPGDIYY